MSYLPMKTLLIASLLALSGCGHLYKYKMRLPDGSVAFMETTNRYQPGEVVRCTPNAFTSGLSEYAAGPIHATIVSAE